MKTRTTREFDWTPELWTVVAGWAVEAGFTLEEQSETRRLYNKGRWLILAPTCVEIRRDGERVVLYAWINAFLYMTMNLMTGKPPEKKLESGGLTAWIQRRRAREAVNPLLIRLGQKPIT